MADPREKPLTDAAVAVTGEYDPHFASRAERAAMETRLFLARWDAMQRLNTLNSFYMRPDCIFTYCPVIGLCNTENRCRHPK